MDSGKEIIDSDHFFGRLPDDVVSLIFNRVHDARSLCATMSVCKRFRFVVPQVRRVFVSVPRKRAPAKDCDEGIAGRNGFKNLVLRVLMRPFYFLSQIILFKAKISENGPDSCSFYSPTEILKPFGGIRELHLQLPCYGFQKQGSRVNGNGGDPAIFLKWKADFGRKLRSCVILGAKSWMKKCVKDEEFQETEHGSGAIDDGEMKLRIVWAISCLMAASARRCLIQETVRDHGMIENLVVSDEGDQGKLCMNREQIEELKISKVNGDEGVLPALRMKMWYAEKLQLSGCERVMEGATLVVIRPRGGGGKVKGRSSTADLVAAAFSSADGEEKVVGEFATMLVAKKCYTLEMNSLGSGCMLHMRSWPPPY